MNHKPQIENPKKKRSQSVSKEEEELLYVPLINPLQHNACYIHTSLHILFYCFDFSDYIIKLFNNVQSINNNIVKALIKMFVINDMAYDLLTEEILDDESKIDNLMVDNDNKENKEIIKKARTNLFSSLFDSICSFNIFF